MKEISIVRKILLSGMISLCSFNLYSAEQSKSFEGLKSIKERFINDIYKVEKATFNYWSNPSFYDSISDELNNLDIDEKVISELNDDELDRAFTKMFRLSFYKNFPSTLFENLFNEKDRRGILKKSDKDLMTRVLIEERDFDKLKIILKKYDIKSDLSDMDIEPFSPKKDMKYLVYNIKDLKKASLINLDIDKGKHIVMVISLSCHFSEMALDMILRDEKAFKIFSKYGSIVMLDFSPESLLFTKKHYYDFDKIYVAYSSKSFKDMNMDEYPGIYFIDNGKVLYSKTGWEKDKGLNEFLSAAEKFNMIADDSIVFPYNNTKNKFVKDHLDKIGNILSKVPEKERMDFLKNIRLKNGVVTYYDYTLLRKYYDGEELIEIIDIFQPFQTYLDKVDNKQEYSIGDIVSDIPSPEKEEFISSLQIFKGLVRGALYFAPVRDLNDNDQRNIKCHIFGDCK